MHTWVVSPLASVHIAAMNMSVQVSSWVPVFLALSVTTLNLGDNVGTTNLAHMVLCDGTYSRERCSRSGTCHRCYQLVVVVGTQKQNSKGCGECSTQPGDSEIFGLHFGDHLAIRIIGPFEGNDSSPNASLKRRNRIRSQRSEFLLYYTSIMSTVKVVLKARNAEHREASRRVMIMFRHHII